MRFYDEINISRVIAGFMAQGGDPNGNGTGGSGKNIKAEFNDIKHEEELYLWQEAMILILQIVNSLYVMILTLFWMGNIRHGEKVFRYESNRENS